MARRYRYSFTRKKEVMGGKISLTLAGLSILLFLAAVAYAAVTAGGSYHITGGLCVFAALCSVYGFLLGLFGFRVKDASHNFCIAGSITNGIIMIAWLGLYLGGL